MLNFKDQDAFRRLFDVGGKSVIVSKTENRKACMSLPELEVKCWKCWGNGVTSWNDHGEMVECPECNGVGWIPTEDGNRLLDFLRRHLGLEFEDEEEPQD